MAERGFTLIELIVVLAVMALLLAAVPVIMSGGLAGVSLKAEAREMAAALRQAHGRAIATNEEVAFNIDVESGRYAVTPGGRAGTLPEGVEARVLPESAAGAIVFFPDGGSTGGSVTISKDRIRYEVRIDWLTGQVSVAD